MTDPRKIAAGLTKAQKRVLRENDTDFVWFRDERSTYGLQRRGLVGEHMHGSCYEWLPLGLAVRQVLIDEGKK